MSPVATGSATVIMTMGTVFDACIAARMTSGLVEMIYVNLQLKQLSDGTGACDRSMPSR